MSTQEVDDLLIRYLHLLDTYTILRSQVTQLQSSVHQSIARANFLSDRGIRYGQDHYDDRLKTIRTVAITEDTDSHTLVSICHSSPSLEENKPKSDSIPDAQDVTQKTEEDKLSSDSPRTSNAPPEVTPSPNPEIPEKNQKEGLSSTSTEEAPRKPSTNTKDPLRMFGLIVPQTLRNAQTHSIQMVENVVPKLVNVDAEMKSVEIEIRRARKKASKAAKQSVKSNSEADIVDNSVSQDLEVKVGALQV